MTPTTRRWLTDRSTRPLLLTLFVPEYGLSERYPATLPVIRISVEAGMCMSCGAAIVVRWAALGAVRHAALLHAERANRPIGIFVLAHNLFAKERPKKCPVTPMNCIYSVTTQPITYHYDMNGEDAYVFVGQRH